MKAELLAPEPQLPAIPQADPAMLRALLEALQARAAVRHGQAAEATNRYTAAEFTAKAQELDSIVAEIRQRQLTIVGDSTRELAA